MVKNIGYIIKRILIGVGIILVLSFIRGNALVLPVSAKEISPYNTQGYYEDITSGYASTSFVVPGAPYKSHGVGILRFSFAITKMSGSSTDPILVPRLVRAYNGNTTYVCNFGSVSNANSTWTGQSYSVECPMDIDSNGLTEILVAYIPFSQQTSSTFRINFPPDISYEYGDSYDNGSSAVNSEAQTQGNATRNTINNATQNIINNDNRNTQQQIESQKVCTAEQTSYQIYSKESYGLNSTGVETATPNFNISKYYSLSDDSKIITLMSYSSSTSGWYFCFYNSNKEVISCSSVASVSSNQQLSIPNGSRFFRTSILKNTNLPLFEIQNCINGNQAIADGQQQINDTLNNDSGVDNNDISDLFGDLEESNTPISDLLTLPINLLTAFLNGFDSTCAPINLGTLYGTALILPCINLESYLGSNLWSVIDLLCSMFMFYNIARLIITAFENITSLKDDYNLLFARHYDNEYQGRHGGA